MVEHSAANRRRPLGGLLVHRRANPGQSLASVRRQKRGHSPLPIPATAALLHFDLSTNKPAAKRLAVTVLDSRITTHLSGAAH